MPATGVWISSFFTLHFHLASSSLASFGADLHAGTYIDTKNSVSRTVVVGSGSNLAFSKVSFNTFAEKNLCSLSGLELIVSGIFQERNLVCSCLIAHCAACGCYGCFQRGVGNRNCLLDSLYHCWTSCTRSLCLQTLPITSQGRRWNCDQLWIRELPYVTLTVFQVRTRDPLGMSIMSWGCSVRRHYNLLEEVEEWRADRLLITAAGQFFDSQQCNTRKLS